LKTLIKTLFLLVFVIYLNNGDIIKAENINRGYTWVKVYKILDYNINQGYSDSRSVEGDELFIPISSILFINRISDGFKKRERKN
jgi:hypothetical protein